MIRFTLIAASLMLLTQACTSTDKQFPASVTTEVVNGTVAQSDLLIIIPEADIRAQAPDFNPDFYKVMLDGTELPSQFNTEDNARGIALVLDSLPASAHVTLTVAYNPAGTRDPQYTRYTQAELSYKTGGAWKEREYIGGEFHNTSYLRVPPEHKDHSWFIRYEGPGWESDRVGYRFYLDQRNATDVFGKKVTTPVLHTVGLDGFDSYHEMSDWGMDVMKVGKSLGVGSIGYWFDSAAIRVEHTDSVTAAITENGVVYSSILTHYYGWKAGADTLNVSSHLSIHKGTRATREHLTVTKDSDLFCTGLVKDDKAVLFSFAGDAGSYGYLATYGPQSLHKDRLGIAVIFPASSFQGFTEDANSHIVKLRSANHELEYYFLAAWEGEPGGITTEEDFRAYVARMARAWANPVTVNVLPR